VLDEPLAALDPVARDDFMRAVRAAVAADGISVVFSTHVVAELEKVADYLIVLGRGQVLFTGTRRGTGRAAWREPGTGRAGLPARHTAGGGAR
jgi:ABC-type multidrug transport system ATPase subunit